MRDECSLLFRTRTQVLDATLKEITAALLESDVNVKLVASLRQKVKAKIKVALDGSDKSKDLNRKHIMQKVTSSVRLIVTNTYPGHKAVFDELVHLVDPGVEPYKPKKGQPNVIMAVGLQVCSPGRPRPECSLERVVGQRKDYDVHKARGILSKAGVQVVYRLCRHLPCWSFRSNPAIRNESQGRLLWIIH